MSDISDDELLEIMKQLGLPKAGTNETNHQDLQEKDEKEEIKDDHGKQIRDGSIQVIDQNIFVVDPTPGGKLARMEASPPVKLTINGQAVSTPQIVRSRDNIEWHVSDPLYSIEVSADKMKAYFQLHSIQRYAWQLKPKEPAFHMVLEAEENQEIVLETIDFAEVIATLQKMRITKNLDTASIYEEINVPTYQPILIAKGEPAVNGVDARLEIYFKEEIENYYVEVDGKVDFRHHLHIPMVQKGDILAKKFPPIEGSVGFNIYGEVSHPHPPKDIMVGATNHVKVLSNGDVIALKEGRPRITGKGVKLFDITTTYTVQGDVDLQTGNILFNGDVVVNGNVMEGMIIEALGSVFVSGHVYRATITATGGITIKGNAVSSRLYSGFYGVLFNRLYHELYQLRERLDQLSQAAQIMMNQIRSRGQKIPMGRMVFMLIQNKFYDIPRASKQLVTLIESIRATSESTQSILDIKKKLFILIQPDGILRIQTIHDLLSLIQLAGNTLQEIYQLQEKNAPIDIRQGQYSELHSTGDIRIRLEGLLQSHLFSEGNIIFYHRHAVCRGGHVEAKGSISAISVGGEIGGITQLKAGKTILINHFFSGRICIGNTCTEIFEPMHHIKIYMKENRLRIEATG